MRKARWEIGSLFHSAPFEPGAEPPAWDPASARLFGSGRDAIRVLLEHLRPDRVLLPSYFCQEVVDGMLTTGIPLSTYPDSPLSSGPPWSEIGLRKGDAVLSVNFFGLRDRAGMRRPDVEGLVVIEDHSHDPCGAVAERSDADYCIASLRKLWPLPDGGVLWSPRGHGLPPEPAIRSELEHASGIKLAGMMLKRLYLQGHDIDKWAYRSLLATGEEALFGTAASGISPWSRAMLGVLPFRRFAQMRRQNWLAFQAAFQPGTGYRVLGPADPAVTPFSALLVFDEPSEADRVHAAMIDAHVYASRLWPLDAPRLAGVLQRDVLLARRSFSLPIDMRYSPQDMVEAAEVIARAARDGP